MMRLSCSRLAKGRMTSWAPNKAFGFVEVTSEKPHPKAVNVDGDSWRLLVHRDSILKNPSGRTVRSIRRGVEVEFDIEVKDDKPVATRVSALGGEALNHKAEIRENNVNVHLMNRTMLPAHLASKPAGSDETLHDKYVRRILMHIGRINNDLQRTAAMQRSTLQLLAVLLKKINVAGLPCGEEYAAMKKILWADRIAQREARRAAKGGTAGHVDDDIDGDDEESDEIMNLLHVDESAGTKRAAPGAKLPDQFHSADDLVGMADDDAPKSTAKKGGAVKGGKKRTKKSKLAVDDDDDLL